MLDRLLHQTWVRHDPAASSRPEPAANPETKEAFAGPPESVAEESAFRGFDSGSVGKRHRHMAEVCAVVELDQGNAVGTLRRDPASPPGRCRLSNLNHNMFTRTALML